MERSRPVVRHRVVVFDLGEVLASPDDLYDKLATLLGSDAETVRSAYWVGRDAHDRGAAAATYWESVITAVGAPTAAADLPDRLSATDAASWTDIRPDAMALLRELDRTGVPVAVLSNAPAELAAVARQTSWSSLVDECFFSGVLALAKPDPAIYTVVTDRLRVRPDQVVFFDDRQANVDAARAAGWDAHLWRSDAATRDVLVALGIV